MGGARGGRLLGGGEGQEGEEHRTQCARTHSRSHDLCPEINVSLSCAPASWGAGPWREEAIRR